MLSRDLLKQSKYADPYQDYFTYEDAIGLICATSDKSIMGEEVMATIPPAPPLLAQRVIKVEGFYCIIEVKEFRFSDGKKGIFDSISIGVRFTNSFDRLSDKGV